MAGCSNNPVAPVADRQAETGAPSSTAFTFPIAGGHLPDERELMPGAPRDYRGGVHEGVDLYTRLGNSPVPCNEPVLNAAEGWVVRADTKWTTMTEGEYNSITKRLKEEYNKDLLDRLRGRQVWVRMADGTILRYCHLFSIANGITPGIRVNPGVVLGAVGNSGTADGAKVTAKNCHLHLEIWTPDGKFLGEGLSYQETRAAWNAAFGMGNSGKQ